MATLRDVALILLAVEAFALALIPLVLLGGLVYGMAWLQRHENLPSWLKVVQAYVSLVQAYVQLVMAFLVKPILVIHKTLATVQRWLGMGARMGGNG